MRKLLRICYLEHKTNDWVPSKISFLAGPQEPVMVTARDRNLHCSGMSYATTASPNHPSGLLWWWATPCWMDNITEWTSLPMPELPTRASCTTDWKKISAESSLLFPRRPNRSRDGTELHSSNLFFFRQVHGFVGLIHKFLRVLCVSGYSRRLGKADQQPDSIK